MLFTPKYSCVNCIYFQKVERGDYGDRISIEITKSERETIKKGCDIELDDGQSLQCFRHQWKVEYGTENHKKENRLIRKRKECKKEDYFYPYFPRKTYIIYIESMKKKEKKKLYQHLKHRVGAGQFFLVY